MEERKDVPGWPGYQADVNGGVWSAHGVGGKQRKPTNPWRMLKPYRRANYLAVELCSGDGLKSVQVYVHQLILLAFVGPYPEGMECLHLNDDCADNRLENLKWGTRAANQQ